jgi:hypothetical protein
MPEKRRWNWPVWAGFLLTLLGVASYVLVFARFPMTRNVPWLSYLLFAVAAALLIVGLRRAFEPSGLHRGRVAGSLLATASVALMALFCYGTLYGSRLPPASKAPKVGEKLSDFLLPDTRGKAFSLSKLLAAPLDATGKAPRGVLLVFYRGYW